MKTAFVTGSSRGIGQAISLSLAKSGYGRIILTSKTIGKLAQTAKQINDLNLNTEVYLVELDLTNHSTVVGELARIWKEISPIDLLVNCAGIANQGRFLNAKPDNIQNELSTNLLGLYSVTQILAKRMVKRGVGTIVNVSSLAGVIAAPGLTGYSATKAAINGFSRALRSELRGTGVDVILLLPTLVKTDMSDNIETHFGVYAINPKQVGQALVKGLKENKKEIVVGLQAHLAICLHNFAPAVTNWLSAKLSPNLSSV